MKFKQGKDRTVTYSRTVSITQPFVRLMIALALALTALVPLALTPRAEAATGDILRTLNVTPAPSCGVTVGIAFDGSELLTSCIENQVLTRVDPATGANMGSIVVSGMGGDGIAAISWDAKNDLLWAGTYGSPMRIYSIVLNKAAGTAVATLAFAVPEGGLMDGLAYDGTDDTLWWSNDVSTTVNHYSLTGTAIGSFQVNLGGCGNSGLVVADATTLYLANNGCAEIYSGQKDGTGTSFFASLSGKRVEDLECDNTTFAAQGKSVIWSKDAYDYELNAFEVPAGQCAEGGVVEVDDTPPSCKLTFFSKNQIQVTVQDTGSGIASIVVNKAVNTTVTTNPNPVPVGTTAPVVVTSTKINVALASQTQITITDVAGNSTTCDPVLTTVIRNAGKPETQTHELAPTDRYATISNDTPGVKNIDLIVNGTKFKATGLKNGETRVIDISSALQEDGNSLTMVARGPKGSSATVMIGDLAP